MCLRATEAEEIPQKLSELEKVWGMLLTNSQYGKGLTLMQRDRDKAFSKARIIVVKVSDFELMILSRESNLKMLAFKKKEAQVIVEQIAARELSTAEEWVYEPLLQ